MFYAFAHSSQVLNFYLWQGRVLPSVAQWNLHSRCNRHLNRHPYGRIFKLTEVKKCKFKLSFVAKLKVAHGSPNRLKHAITPRLCLLQALHLLWPSNFALNEFDPASACAACVKFSRSVIFKYMAVADAAHCCLLAFRRDQLAPETDANLDIRMQKDNKAAITSLLHLFFVDEHLGLRFPHWHFLCISRVSVHNVWTLNLTSMRKCTFKLRFFARCKVACNFPILPDCPQCLPPLGIAPAQAY